MYRGMRIASRNNLNLCSGDPKKGKYGNFKKFLNSRRKIVLLILLQTFLIFLFFNHPLSGLLGRKNGSGGTHAAHSKSGRILRGIFGQDKESLESIVAQIRKDDRGGTKNSESRSLLKTNFLRRKESRWEGDKEKKMSWMEQIRGAIGEKDANEYKIANATRVTAILDSEGPGELESDKWGGIPKKKFLKMWKMKNPWPPRNSLTPQLEKLNALPPRNKDLFPNLPKNRIVFVLYVHNRPPYLKVVLDSLSKVTGINETLLIVSHDGKFSAMDELVQAVKFCQVKQIYAPFSPHNFQNTFPQVSANDCVGKKDNKNFNSSCLGQHDAYNNYRDPHYISLKHHWWWMMNTVWDGLEETRDYNGNIVFIEEDHFIFPNAYEHLKLLLKSKDRVCPNCIAVNLAPSQVLSRGENTKIFVSEKMGNVGYSFNRTIWNAIHADAHKFCNFDDYNWDLTLWHNLLEYSWAHHYSLRWSRTSAFHIGKCGLHGGKNNKQTCTYDGLVLPNLESQDYVANIIESASMSFISYSKFPPGFKGFGGWGDWRDQELCKYFTFMHRTSGVPEVSRAKEY